MGREELTLSTTGGHLWDRVHKAIADATLERDARTQLVGAGEIDDPATLGTQAGAALRGAVYRHVAIWTEGEQAIIECRTYSGAIHRIAIAPGEIDRTLDESGVGHYLGATAFGASRIREALHDACRTGSRAGRDNQLLQRPPPPVNPDADVERRERLGGLLSFYYREAARGGA